MLLKMRQFLHFQMDASDVKMTIINFVVLAHMETENFMKFKAMLYVSL